MSPKSRYFLGASSLLVMCIQVAVIGPGRAAADATVVLNDTNEPPFTTAARDGFVDVIAGEAFHRAGLSLKFVKLPPERALMNANAGIEDGDVTRIIGLEKDYPNLIRVPEKLVDWTFAAFTRKTESIEASWPGLESFAVGHIKGWKIFEKNLRPKTLITTADDPNQLFTMLDKNRVEVALYERWMGAALLKRMNITDVRVVEPPLAVREMFIYLHRRHADKVPAIVAALRSIKSEGMYARVCREKFAPLATPSLQCDIK